jgi:hypothetical protein
MTDTIAEGSILVDKGGHLPKSLVIGNKSDTDGWAGIEDGRSAVEKVIQEDGWTYFFMAGEIKATGFGLDRQKRLGAARQRLVTDAKAQNANSVEITAVTGKSFLGVPYVSVTAHVRHLQKGLLFSGNGDSI